MAMFYTEPNNAFQGSLLDSSLEGYNQPEQMSSADESNQMVDYMLNNLPPPSPPLLSNFCFPNSFNKLSFAEVMPCAEFGPKLALNEARSSDEETGIDPLNFLKLPVLNDNYLQDDLVPDQLLGGSQEGCKGFSEERLDKGVGECDYEAQMEDNTSTQRRFQGENLGKSLLIEAKKKRKRPKTIKTSEEVESHRMTHIMVERNRRKQMNEHLRILRSLMPNSYVQRGDQASIIGGAIEFVRELEQLLQCLESQKRRRLYGDGQTPIEGPPITLQQPHQGPPIFRTIPIPNDQVEIMEYETRLHEETAESKSCLADVEVSLIGSDGLIKILSRRRPGQLIKTISALEDLQLHILQTNITTIEQTVLYSFNVKIRGETMFTAEDIANSIQQTLSLIHSCQQ